MAVAGFAQEELSIVHEPNMLVVCGERVGDENAQYLHRGIAGRPFERRFELADHVKVTAASLVNGMLTVDLRRELPDEMKPRRIEIGSAQRGVQTKANGATVEKQVA